MTDEVNQHVIYSDGDRVVERLADTPNSKGGAPTRYIVGAPQKYDDQRPTLAFVKFQHDTIKKVGVVGVTNEVLLAIVKDRLEGFQAGPFPSDYNAAALTCVKEALEHLEARTADRKDRGVEGEHKE